MGQPEPLTEGPFKAFVAEGQTLPPATQDMAEKLARENAFFHWHVAFPEVFAKGGLEGRTFGTMCLSEPQAGSSLSDIVTRAVPDVPRADRARAGAVLIVRRLALGGARRRARSC